MASTTSKAVGDSGSLGRRAKGSIWGNEVASFPNGWAVQPKCRQRPECLPVGGLEAERRGYLLRDSSRLRTRLASRVQAASSLGLRLGSALDSPLAMALAA